MEKQRKIWSRRCAKGALCLLFVLTAFFGMSKNQAKASETAVADTAHTDFANEALVLAAGEVKAVDVPEVFEYSVITPMQEQTEDSIAYFDTNANVHAVKEGTVSLGLNVDGKIYTVQVIVTDPRVLAEEDSILKGETKNITLEGINQEKSVLIYESSDETIATVSENGLLEAKEEGTVQITIIADGRELVIHYVVDPEIPKDAGKKAAKKAIAISKTKTKYSQTKRMEGQYYDCSSLVARIYRLYKVYFGVEDGWAPTAAEIAEWCASNDKVIAQTGVSYKKLKKGDLIFYSYRNNGRYKNINHVEIYVGADKCVSASESKNKVVYCAYKKSSVVMIARPVK